MISQAIPTTSKDSPQSTSGQLVERWCSMKEIRPNKTSLISLRRTGMKLPNKSQQKMSFEKCMLFCHVPILGMVLLESWIIHLVSVLWSYWVLLHGQKRRYLFWYMWFVLPFALCSIHALANGKFEMFWKSFHFFVRCEEEVYAKKNKNKKINSIH